MISFIYRPTGKRLSAVWGNETASLKCRKCVIIYIFETYFKTVP